MSKKSDDSNAPRPGANPRRDEPPLEIDTRELLGTSREVTIIHDGERYRLRVTSQNKLILTK